MEALMKLICNYDSDSDSEDDHTENCEEFYADYLDFHEIEIVFKFLETYRRQNGIKEIYEPIPNYDNYEVSNYGNVREKRKKKILKYTYDDRHQHVREVTLNKDGKRKKFMVWYLQLLSFERA